MNVYSFNKLLMDGEIDLFDVLDFCAKYNFDATDLVKAWVVAAAKLGIPTVRVFAGTHKHEGFTRDQVF